MLNTITGSLQKLTGAWTTGIWLQKEQSGKVMGEGEGYVSRVSQDPACNKSLKCAEW